MQKWVNALGPGGFIVLGAFDALVLKVLAEPPAFLQKDVAKLFHFMNDARAFLCADVEPDARAGLDRNILRETMNEELIPPYRRRKSRHSAEDLWMLEGKI